MNKIIGLLVVLSTFVWDILIYTENQDFLNTGKIRVFLLAAFLIYARHLAHKLHLSAGIAVAFLGVHFTFFTYLPFHGREAMLMILAGSALAAWVANLREDQQGWIFFGLAITAVLQGILGIVNLSGEPIWPMKPGFEWMVGLPRGTIGQPTFYGPFLLALAPFFWFCGDRPRGRQVAVVLTALALSTRSAATVGCLFVLLAAYWMQGAGEALGRRLNAALIGLAGVLVLLGLGIQTHEFRFFSDSGRFAWWRAGYLAWTSSPWLGHGLGSWYPFAVRLGEHAGLSAIQVFGQAHTDWGQIPFELGVAGLAVALVLAGVFYYLFVTTPLSNFQKAAAAPFIVMSADAMVNFPFRRPSTAIIAVISWAIIVRVRRPRTRTNGSSYII